jgi:hypothetical protein
MERPRRAGSAEEFLVSTELLPAMRERYQSEFLLLAIPEVVRFDRDAGPHGTVYFQHYDGGTYNDRWSEQNGGSALGTELSSEMVQLVRDLQTIDVDWLLSRYLVGQAVRQSAFDLRGWLLSFREQKAHAIKMGISATEIAHAEEFVNGEFESTRRIVSNGDFYPRNLIKLPNRMVLVDWGYWPGYRACFVDYPANVAAFAFIHMWGNRLWQKEFVRRVIDTLAISPDDLRKAILIKSFEQARFWQGNPDLTTQVAAQVNHFRMALTGDIFS